MVRNTTTPIRRGNSATGRNSTAGSVAGSTAGSTAGSATGSVAGSTAGSTAGSATGSVAGFTTGSVAGSTAGSTLIKKKLIFLIILFLVAFFYDFWCSIVLIVLSLEITQMFGETKSKSQIIDTENNENNENNVDLAGGYISEENIAEEYKEYKNQKHIRDEKHQEQVRIYRIQEDIKNAEDQKQGNFHIWSYNIGDDGVKHKFYSFYSYEKKDTIYFTFNNNGVINEIKPPINSGNTGTYWGFVFFSDGKIFTAVLDTKYDYLYSEFDKRIWEKPENFYLQKYGDSM
jgi:hypothetical protein